MLACLAAYGFVVAAGAELSAHGMPVEVPATLILAYLATAGASSVFQIGLHALPLTFYKLTPVSFGRLTGHLVLPHLVVLAPITLIAVAVELGAGGSLATVGLLLLQSLWLPLLAWCIAVRYLNRQLLPALLYVFLGTGGLVAAIIRPWLFVGLCLAALWFIYRGASSRYLTTRRGRVDQAGRFSVTPMIQFDEVTKTYRGTDRGVFGLNFTVSPGLTGFLGRNGSGKTTTMRLLVGLLMPDSGRIVIDDKDLWEYPHLLELKRDLGFLPNEHYFFGKLTGRENLEYLSLLKTGERDGYRALDDLGRRLDLEQSLERPFADYSTGMRKKVQLLGALIGDPAILVLDEPFNGLDVLANIVLRRLLLERCDRGKVVFVSSHLADLFDTMAGRLLIIEEGRIVHDETAPFPGKVADLYLDALDQAAPPPRQ